MRATIWEVAKLAGVSNATVSKVLNDAPGARVAGETRERVRRAATQLGYTPNALARGMRRRRFDTIGVILPPGAIASHETASELDGNAGSDGLAPDARLPLDFGFIGMFLNHLLRSAIALQQNVTILTGRVWRDAETSLSQFNDGRCDGFLVTYQPDDTDLIDAFASAGVPFVLVNDDFPNTRASRVDIDNFDAAYRLMDHLLDLGHRRIAIFANESRARYMQPRWDGCRAAMADRGLVLDVDFTFEVGWSFEKTADAVDRLLALPGPVRPTALLALESDDLAADCLRVLHRRGCHVPSEMSVAGFNDDAIASKTIPPLTTMRLPYREIVDTALRLLRDQIDGGDMGGQHVIHQAGLVARGSTAHVEDVVMKERL